MSIVTGMVWGAIISTEGKCEGKKFTLTLTLTLFLVVNQSVTVKSEGVRVKKEKTFFYKQLLSDNNS